MELSSATWGCGTTILEQAKEELQILEAQHPNRFEYLKVELKSFIFLLECQNPCANSVSLPTSSTATTQASSVGRKRKKCSSEIQGVMEGHVETRQQKLQRGESDGFVKGRKDRVDVLIERAQACLHKIQQFKTNYS